MRKLLSVLTFILLAATCSFGQIKEFFLTCQQSDFDYIYENYELDIYIPVSLTYSGTTWPNATMRIRGDGSRVFPKKSLKLRLNSAPEINGQTSLNFNAEWEDQSYIQQALASRLMKESGQKCFNTEHIRLYLNGSFLGLYLMVEGIDEHFLETSDLDTNGTLYKASLDGSSMSLFDVPAFHWNQEEGPNLGMTDLQTLINDLNGEPQSSYSNFVNQRFIRSEMVNMISMNILLSVGSTYYHNYFMYHEPTTDKWSMLPWDLDKTLLYYGSDFPYHRSSTIWAPDNPYLEKAIHNDQLLSEIRSRIVALQSSIFNAAYVDPIIDSIQNVISNSVSQDQTDDISGLAFWQNKIGSYQNAFNQRVANVLNQIDEYPRNFTVERIASAAPGAQITLHWTSSESPLQNPISYRLFFGNDLDLESTASIILNSISGTEVSFNVPTTEGQYYYKVQAYDGFNYVDGFDTYNPIIVTDNVPDLVINEINYNSSLDFDAGDWFEIYNPLSVPVDLANWYIRDDQNDHLFTFGEGSLINGNGFLVVCRGIVPFQTVYPNVNPHSQEFSFGLGNSVDAIRLFHHSGLLVDEVFYSDTVPWPGEADGLGPTLELNSPELNNMLASNWTAWTDHLGTPGASNRQPNGVEEMMVGTRVEIYPNPVLDQPFNVSFFAADKEPVQVTITDPLGKELYRSGFSTIANSMNTIAINTQLFSSGTYLLTIRSATLNETRSFIYQNKP